MSSALMVLRRFSEASLRGWFAAVTAITSPGMCSSSLRISVMSVYPRVRTMGVTRALDVRNWGLSWVLTPRLGGVTAPEITMADTFLPRARSISASACLMVPMMSFSDATMGVRFSEAVMSVAGGGDRKRQGVRSRSGTSPPGTENPLNGACARQTVHALSRTLSTASETTSSMNPMNLPESPDSSDSCIAS